ncbi:MAG TPA: hypothetical protein VMT03_11505 [Polyangia bacterium]|nr:hypothetical protein [Polyangia bacterium]
MKRIGLIMMALFGCQTNQPRSATQEPPKPAVVQEVPEKVVPVTGWRNLRWGDTSKQVAAKSKGGRLVCGWVSRDGKKKGHMTASQVCFLTNESGGRLAMINLVYLDDTLQRIVVGYLGLSPDTSEVDNLNDLLVQRYCLLSDNGTAVHLNAAIKQSKQGNAGQSLQLQSVCKTSPGDFFVQIQNNQGSSDVRIFLSSDSYGAYLQQNEFADQWEDGPPIERPAEPQTIAVVPPLATSPPPQSSLHPDKGRPAHAAAERHPNGSHHETDEHGNSWLCRDGSGCELESPAEGEPPPVPSPARPVHRQDGPAKDSDDWGEPLHRQPSAVPVRADNADDWGEPPHRQAPTRTTGKTSSQPEQPKFVDPFE